MGILRSDDSERMEIEEFRRMLLQSCAGIHRRKDGDDDEHALGRRVTKGGESDGPEDRIVCVTSGVSYLGVAIISQLLLRGYSVRIIVDNEEDVEKVREMELTGEMRGNIEAVLANVMELESLSRAFNGCRGVFHTSAFVDPSGLSGYSKHMGDIEVKGSQNVIKACAETPSVRHCVFTSSLLACTWQDTSIQNVPPPVIDHDSWSDESLCINKKLWFALGKTRAEKEAWRLAKETDVNLVTICPGLITGPEFCRRSSTSTIAYLKGAQEMYTNGVLATTDVKRLAEAQLLIYEAMNNNTAFGRYICFDKIISTTDEIEKLEIETGVQINVTPSNFQAQFRLSNVKLSGLMSTTIRRCNHDLLYNRSLKFE